MAVDCLPVATRRAMLQGLQDNDRIIAGAYVDEQGGDFLLAPAAMKRGGVQRGDGLGVARAGLGDGCRAAAEQAAEKFDHRRASCEVSCGCASGGRR